MEAFAGGVSFCEIFDAPWKIAAAVIACIVFLCAISLALRPSPYNANLKELVRQCAQLYEIAKQDQDAAVALQHSTEALSILLVCRRLAADAVIEAETKVKVSELGDAVAALQASCIAKLSLRDPTLTAIAAGYAQL